MTYKDIQLYRELHTQNPAYGASGIEYYHAILDFINFHSPNSVLDFGCGKGTLVEKLRETTSGVIIDGFDPALQKFEITRLKTYQMIITTDVLEHIHIDELDTLFKDIKKFQPNTMYHVVCNREAVHILPDGSNAHKIVESVEWWAEKIKTSFDEYDVKYHVNLDKSNFCLVKK